MEDFGKFMLTVFGFRVFLGGEVFEEALLEEFGEDEVKSSKTGLSVVFTVVVVVALVVDLIAKVLVFSVDK